MNPRKLILCCMALCFAMACNDSSQEPDRRSEADVLMTTDVGEVYIKLYDETPKHKENFLKLVKEGFYDGITFHRVIRQFMVQAGDPRTREVNPSDIDDAGYTLPPEIIPTMLHTRGKLSAARYPDNVNPKWESSSSQFFIVTGKKHSSEELDQHAENYNMVRQGLMYKDFVELYKKGEAPKEFNDYLASKDFTFFGYSDEQKKIYQETKGTPNLDFMYTIFGEVVNGMDVIEKIEYVPTNGSPYDQPLEPIRIISMKIFDPASLN